MNAPTPIRSQLLRGTLLKWNEQAGYHDRDGVKPVLGPYYVIGLARGYERWQNQILVGEIIDEPLPDLAQLNSSIPRSEWELGLNGQLREPWQLVHAIFLFSLASGEFFTLKNSTVGMKILYENFLERWQIMKTLRGANVLARVELATRPFKTAKWGVKQRSDLKVLDWQIAEGQAGNALFASVPPALPVRSDPTRSTPTSAPPPPAAASPPSAPQGQVTFLPPLKSVKPPTLSEEMGGDDIPK